jgi:hypothetical protein
MIDSASENDEFGLEVSLFTLIGSNILGNSYEKASSKFSGELALLGGG